MLNIEIKKGAEGRRKILKGASQVGEIVGVSLGPRGRSAIIKTKYSAPQIHNDGVTIARHIMLKDEIEDLGAQTLIEGAMKTDNRAGDGTTGCIVISSKGVNDCAKRIEEEDKSNSNTGAAEATTAANADVNKMAREILDTGRVVVEQLKKNSHTLKKDELKSVISTSLGTFFPEYVDELTDIVDKVGKDGYISVEDNWATQYGIDTELVKGMKFTGSYATPYMVTNRKTKEAVYEDVPVLICNEDIATMMQFMEDPKGKHIMSEILSSGKRKLVIIANKFERPFIELMNATVSQARSGNTGLIDFLCIKAPSLTTEQLEDVAVYTNAAFFDKKNETHELKKSQAIHLGFVEKIVVNEDEVIMLGGAGKKALVKERLDLLQAQADKEKDSAFKEQTKRRIGALQSGFAVIRVGAATEGDRTIRKKKIEDAKNAAQAALAEGVVKGGGVALKDIADELGEDHLMYGALTEPYNLIKRTLGDEKMPKGILDPLKVIRIQVETAFSTIASLITCEVAIAEKSPGLWDELEDKIFPQKQVNDDFRDEHPDEGGFK